MNKKFTIIYTIILLIYMLCFTVTAEAYVRSSTNYRIEKDSVNTGGVETGASASYKIRDTVGEVGTGESQSASYIMHAGYRQMDETYLAVSAPASVALTPAIPTGGGTASGNGTWTVKTDSATGYNLSIKASTSPALHAGANNFADYTPAVAGTPDYSWSIGAVNSEFGYSPYNSASQVNKFKNDGSACNTGAAVSDGQCWYGCSTSYEQIVNKTSRTTTAGEDTKINFQAEVNASGSQTAGNYIATIVVTIISN